jgi:hypothetical protein
MFNGLPNGTFGLDNGFALENTHVFYICDDFKSILILCFESDMGEHESIKIGGLTIIAGEKSTVNDDSFYYIGKIENLNKIYNVNGEYLTSLPIYII